MRAAHEARAGLSGKNYPEVSGVPVAENGPPPIPTSGRGASQIKTFISLIKPV